jgi:hypothetical protein
LIFLPLVWPEPGNSRRKGRQHHDGASRPGQYVIEPGAWEGIVSIFCHLPVPARQRLYRQVAVGLRSGGVFLLEAYTPKQLEYGTGRPASIELLVPLTTVRDELAGLEWELAREVEREIYEGRCHTGHSAVVQLLGRKVVPGTA